MVFAADEQGGVPEEMETVEKGRVSVELNSQHSDNEKKQQWSVKNSSGRFSFSSLRNSSGKVGSSHEFAVDICEPSAKRRKESTGPLPITLKFEDVEYTVTIQPTSSWFEFKGLGASKKQGGGAREKHILHGVSGVVKPGEILAMLGPSGSGKTTLLNILGGRVKGRLAGQVLFNDSSFTKGMKRRTGFVTQDDVLFAHLTVKETLVYAAYLRLPDSEFTKAAKLQRAEAVITELGLEKCKDTVIGGPFLRGVSGGERKRVSIGHEMLVDPSLLLLDEPTSGLDSTIALKIIHTLQDLSRGGRTVVTTIHQPSSIIFHTFTKLLLLSDGHSLYYGLGSQAMSYFESVGFKPAFATNPADFLLDLASGITYDIRSTNDDESVIEAGTKDTNRKVQPGLGQSEILLTLREAYLNTLLGKTRRSISDTPVLTEEEYKASQEKRKWPTTWLDQFNILLSRGIKERRHDAFAGLRVAQVTTISIICGLLWWRSTPNSIQDQVGLLFFLTTFWGLFPVFLALFTFPVERLMLMKERSSGMYRLSAYFLARTIGDLPLELALPFISINIIYWMGGLKISAAAYFSSVSVVLLTALVSQGAGLLLGAALMDVKKATTLSSVLLMSFQLAGGYFVTSIPVWVGWIKYVSFNYYGFKLQLAGQYSRSETYACDTGRCLIYDYPAVQKVGTNHVGISLAAMLLMMFGYRFFTYVALRQMELW